MQKLEFIFLPCFQWLIWFHFAKFFILSNGRKRYLYYYSVLRSQTSSVDIYDSFNSKEVGNFHFPVKNNFHSVKKKLQVIAPVFCLDFLTKVDSVYLPIAAHRFTCSMVVVSRHNCPMIWSRNSRVLYRCITPHPCLFMEFSSTNFTISLWLYFPIEYSNQMLNSTNHELRPFLLFKQYLSI